MNQISSTFVVLAYLCLTGCVTQTMRPTGPFQSLDPDAAEPFVFFPEAVSQTATPQWDIAFSPDGSTLFYSTDAPRRILTQSWSRAGWSQPRPATDIEGMNHGGVSVSPDGQYLYFSAAPDGQKRDIYRQSLTEPETAPIRMTDTPLFGEISLSVDVSGNGFIWTDTKRDGSAGIGFYRISIQGDELQILEDSSNLHLGDSSGENSPFVDPDGRFLLFANYGIAAASNEDLFLSELRDGVPLPPVSLGIKVNSSAAESSPSITPDRKFLLFASDRPPAEGADGEYQILAIPTASIPVLNAVLSAETSPAKLNLSPLASMIVTSDAVIVRDGIDYLAANDMPYTGAIQDRYPDGNIKRRKHLVNGKVQGVWIEWYPSGVPSFYSEWNDDKAKGTWIYFHETGEISERAFAENDVWMGAAEGWSKSGDKTYQAIFRDGVQTSRFRASPLSPAD